MASLSLPRPKPGPGSVDGSMFPQRWEWRRASLCCGTSQASTTALSLQAEGCHRLSGQARTSIQATLLPLFAPPCSHLPVWQSELSLVFRAWPENSWTPQGSNSICSPRVNSLPKGFEHRVSLFSCCLCSSRNPSLPFLVGQIPHMQRFCANVHLPRLFTLNSPYRSETQSLL